MNKEQQKYNGVYHKLPTTAEGAVPILTDKSKTVILYNGSDPIVARLIWNMGHHDFVPKGETMETMP